MSRFFNANKIMNRVAVEVGLTQSNDAFADPDQSFQQMGGLLNSAGQEMAEIWGWELLRKTWTITTTQDDIDQGFFDFPDDYGSMIDQTAWDPLNNVPIAGPMSPQQWSFITQRGIATNTIYPVFMLAQDALQMYPFPTDVGRQYSFGYLARGWVEGTGITDEVVAGSNIVLYKPIMMIKFLKVKWQEAKGLDASASRLEFDNVLQSELGKDTGAPKLHAGARGQGHQYLNGYTSVPDSFYGDWSYVDW
jgi:hypothetical protein